jgi:hypothetical protein
MAGSDYLARQAATLLRLAKITKDAKLSAQFAAKAADLSARAEEAAQDPSDTPPVEDKPPVDRR